MTSFDSRRLSNDYGRVETSAEIESLLNDNAETSHFHVKADRQGGTWSTIPKKPLSAVLFACLPEGFGELIMVPFIYPMVRHMQPGLTDGEVAFYVGLVGTCNFLPLFVSNIFAGALSDRIGRRKIFLWACVGNGIGNLLFGLSTSIPMLLLTRLLTGMWSYNSTVAKSVLGDISTPATRGIVFGLYGSAFGVAALVAPIIGGAIVNPADGMPGLVEYFPFLERYPYLLPFVLISLLSLISFILCFMWLTDKPSRTEFDKLGTKDSNNNSSAELLVADPGSKRRVSIVSLNSDHVEVEVRSRPTTPVLTANEPETLIELGDGTSMARETLVEDSSNMFQAMFEFSGPNTIYTRPVVVSIAIYMLLAFAFSLYYTLVAIWGAAQREDGGLEYPPTQLSFLSSTYGLVKIVFQLFIFPNIVTKMGPITTLRIGAVVMIATMLASSALSAISPDASGMQYAGALLSSSFMAIGDVFGYLAVFVILTDASPSSKLGLIHGVASTGAAASRMAGPTLLGAIWSFGSSYYDGNQIASFASIALVVCIEYVLTLPYFY